MTDNQNPLEPPKPPLAELPVASIHMAPSDAGAVQHQNTAVRWPEEDLNDFPVGVRASVLRRCRKRLTSLATARFEVGELLLGVACLSFGGMFSALTSGIPLDSVRGGFFYIGLPVIGIGSGVAYVIKRQAELVSVRQSASELLRDLPDPAKAKAAEDAQ